MNAPAPLVSISSSLDKELGFPPAPLDSDLSTEHVAAVVRRCLDNDVSGRSLKALVKPGSWVVVKPNIVTSPTNPKSMYWCGGVPHHGQNTDLRVVKAVVDYVLLHCRPRRLTIAEGGSEWFCLGKPDTPADLTEDGWTVHWLEFGGLSYADLVAGWASSHPGVVDIVDLNHDQRRFLPVPDPRGSGIGALQRRGGVLRPKDRFGRDSFEEGTGAPLEGYDIPVTILDCDLVVSCPAMKTHLIVGTSLGLKNYVGITDPARAVNHPTLYRNSKIKAHQGEVNCAVVDAFSYHPADYSIVEGFWGTEGNGPQWGDDIQHNVVVAGADPVAVDAVSAAVMGYNPEDIGYLHLAARKRFGEMDLRRIKVAGSPIASVQRHFRMGKGTTGLSFSGRGIREWLVASADRPGWTQVDSGDRYVNLAHHLGADVPFAVWAYGEIECEKPISPELWIGSDGPLELYVRGEQVLSFHPPDGHCLGEKRVRLALPAGVTGFLLRVERGSARFGFSLLLCGEPGILPQGIHHRTPDRVSARTARDFSAGRAG